VACRASAGQRRDRTHSAGRNDGGLYGMTEGDKPPKGGTVVVGVDAGDTAR
jgi:hypothetical protein